MHQLTVMVRTVPKTGRLVHNARKRLNTMWTLAPGLSWVAGTIPPTMLTYPHIDPVALQLGPLAIHWYGITYLVAFGLFMFLGTRRLRHEPFASITGPSAWTRKDVEDILFLGVVGVVIGGRLGYCLFYKPGYYLTHPLEILRWAGRHGVPRWPVGVIAAMLWFAHSRKRPWLQVADFCGALRAHRPGCRPWVTSSTASCGAALPAPICPGAWCLRTAVRCSRATLRRSTSSCWKGCCCLCCCGLYARRERKQGQVAAAFLVGYGSFRFIAEYFREPDSFLGLCRWA